MTATAWSALRALGLTIGGFALAHLLLERAAGGRRRNPGRRKPRWVTLSNRRRVELEDDGRIEKGLPETYRGVHVQDVSELSRGIRTAREEGESCARRSTTQRGRKFRSVDQAVRELLGANPDLVDFLERECSHDCEGYRAWRRRGRGRKPQWVAGDGRFDAINERLERRGARKVSSWLEAVYATVPPSKRWEDFADRVQVLEEATGLRLALPAPAERLASGAADAARCREGADEQIDELVARARAGRLGGRRGAELEAAPF